MPVFTLTQPDTAFPFALVRDGVFVPAERPEHEYGRGWNSRRPPPDSFYRPRPAAAVQFGVPAVVLLTASPLVAAFAFPGEVHGVIDVLVRLGFAPREGP